MRMRKAVATVAVACMVAVGIPFASFASDEQNAWFSLGEPIALDDASAVSDASSDGAVASEDSYAADAVTADAVATDAITADASVATKTSGLTGRTCWEAHELRALWNALVEEPLEQEIYAQAGDVTTYSAATLADSAYAYAEGYINFIRAVAGLGSVSLDDTLNANAAQGALILARLNDSASPLTHYPATPTGVTDEQAAAGKYACSTSNLSYSYNYSTVLSTALRGQLDDKSDGNRSTVGHRRWLLDPYTSTLGIGVANNGASYFTDIRVMGTSEQYGSVTSVAADYEFIAWPASGTMPNQVFSSGTPWSISLNSSLYAAPDAQSVTVEVTRLSDGTVWTLDASDASGASITDEYFAVSNAGYGGVPYCVIFNPGTDNLGQDALTGTYKVSVSGLQLASGEQTTLAYEVDFVDLEAKTFDRLSGDTRYDTMLEVVRAEAGTTAGKPVVLTTGANYPDALSANGLAGMLGGTVVLTEPTQLNAQTCAALETLAPSQIYVVGGTSSVSAKVMSAASAYAPTTRVYGATRVETADAVYEKGAELGTWGTTCIIASSQGFADAMSASPLAYATAAPIFLANASGTLDAATCAHIANGGFSTVLIVGGESAVSSQVETQLKTLGESVAVTRLQGATRYDTNKAIVEYELNTAGLSVARLAVATGRNYPDALAGGTLCGSANSVMLLLPGTTRSVSPFESLLSTYAPSIDQGYVLGGINSISSVTLSALNVAAGT